MEQALTLPKRSSLLVPLLAFVIGAGGATLTYAAVDGASFDLTSGDGPAAKRAPHAGTGGVTAKHAPVTTR
jgi:hypothetical protein